MELGELVVIECVASDSSIIPLSPNGLMVHATTPRLASGIRPEAKSVEKKVSIAFRLPSIHVCLV